METIESDIAVIRNSGRILLYWDTGWDCWLLPNATIHEPCTADKSLYWAVGDLGLPPRLWDTTGSLVIDSHKPCPQHDDTIRHYVYTLGFYDLDVATDYEWDCVHNHYLIDVDDWQDECDFYGLDHLEFDVDGHDCTWWTIDEMRADPRMRAVNGDLIGTLELIEAGLLPSTKPVPTSTRFDRTSTRPRP